MNRGHLALCAPGDHRVRIWAVYNGEGFPERMRSSGTCSGASEIGTSRPVTDGDLAGCQVCDGSRDEERRYTRRTLPHEFAVFPLDHFECADAASNIDSNPFSIFRRHLNRSLCHVVVGSCHRELDEPPHFLHVFSLYEVFRHETLYFTRKSAGIFIGGQKGYRRYSTSHFQNPLPSLFSPNTQPAYKPDASDNNRRQPLLT